MFIGRHKEIEGLFKRYNSNKKEFIAITGKRGVGKTELMLKTKNNLLNSNKDVIMELVGKKGQPFKKQLKNADDVFNDLFNENITSKNWDDFFKKIILKANSLSSENKKLFLFIDEFPWLNTKGSYFVDDFGAFWNHFTGDNLKIIITGSAVSWMSKNVFRNVGGLYHKITHSIHLKPFNLIETAEYLLKINKHFTNNEIVEYYLMTGGVARYLHNIHPFDSIEENRNVIYKNNYYLDFFNNSFSSNKNIHENIVKLFSDRIKLSYDEIVSYFKSIGLSHSIISNAIDELVETDILFEIENYNPRKKTKNVLTLTSKANKAYVLSDLFFFNFLRKNNVINKGFSFEIMVMNNLDLFFNNQNFVVSKWNSKKKKDFKDLKRNKGKQDQEQEKAQIDLLIEFENKTFTLIECKYYNDIYSFNHIEENKISNRINIFKEECNKKQSFINVILISMWGSENKTSYSYVDLSINNFLNEKLLHFR